MKRLLVSLSFFVSVICFGQMPKNIDVLPKWAKSTTKIHRGNWSSYVARTGEDSTYKSPVIALLSDDETEYPFKPPVDTKNFIYLHLTGQNPTFFIWNKTKKVFESGDYSVGLKSYYEGRSTSQEMPILTHDTGKIYIYFKGKVLRFAEYWFSSL